MVKNVSTNSSCCLKMVAVIFVALVLFESLAEAGKGRDIIIYNGKVILKGGKKKGNIVISNGNEGHGQGKYKYNNAYMNYGGFWRRR